MWYSLLGLQLIAPDDFLAHVVVNSDSPWFCGHFPDNPILPGIAQLNMVVEVIAKSRNENLYIKRLSRVKFKKLVRPGELLKIHAVATDVQGHYTFQITNEAQDVCSGVISLAEKQ
jgi:3-hydroxymyristoyl/3-hydroxydecanoyl-(acyl carrier protein) dehydratase